MASLVRICGVSELPAAGQVREFTVGGQSFCVANVDGAVCVLDGICPHEGGPLGEGELENGRVVCPWHSYAFDVRTGENDEDPELKARVFSARVEDGALVAEV